MLAKLAITAAALVACLWLASTVARPVPMERIDAPLQIAVSTTSAHGRLP